MTKSGYKVEDFYMLRTPVKGLPEYLSLNKLLTQDEFKDISDFNYLLSDPKFKEAIAIASLDLYESVSNISDFKSMNRKIQESLFKYCIRMSTRPTPYGAFSGVCCGTFSDKTNILLSSLDGNKKRARADMEWIYGIVKLLEEDKDILHNVRIRFNEQCYEHGNRFKNPYVSNYGQTYGNITNLNQIDKSSIRYTNQVKFIREYCKDFIVFGEVLNTLSKNNISTPVEKIYDFLIQLLKNEYLITELRPTLYSEDPLNYIIRVLSEIDNKTNIYNQLLDIEQMIKKYNEIKIGEGLNLYLEICNQMKKLHNSKNFIQVDTSILCTSNIIGNSVKEELEDLAEALMKMFTELNEPEYLVEYRKKFMEEFGTNMEVSLLELIDTDIGLGYPNEYKFYDSMAYNQHKFFIREERFKKIINDKLILSLKNGTKEIKICDEDIEYLNQDYDVQKISFSKSFELNIIISSKSSEDIDNGQFTLYVGPNHGSQKAGNSFNRFYDILDKKYINKLEEIYRSEKENSKDEYVIADIYEVPRKGRINNVGMGKKNHDYHIIISSNTNNQQEKININDLYIGIDEKNDKLYIKSKSLNKKVKVVSDNMLNHLVNSKLARFLREISYSYEIHPVARLSNLVSNDYKYVPKIIYGKTVLQNATWKINKNDFNNLRNISDFKKGFKKIMDEFDIPRYVYHSQADNRLLLDLDSEYYHEYIYKVVKNSKQPVILTELEDGGFKSLWIRDKEEKRFFSEIVVPFTLKKNKNKFKEQQLSGDILETKSNVQKNINRIGIIDKTRVLLPGDDNWIFLKLYGNSQRVNELIGFHFNEFLDEMLEKNIISKYFFIRYADPEQHVRLRIQGQKDRNIFEAFPEIIAWINGLKKEGLISKVVIDTYIREIERYGGTILLPMAEDFFYRDSLFVAKIMELKEKGAYSLDDDIMGMLGVLFIIKDFIGDLELEELYLSGIVGREEFRADFQKNRKKYMDIVELVRNIEEVNDINEVNTLKEILLERGKSITRYREIMDVVDSNNDLCNTKNDILSSLIHMFCNRFMGNRNWERKILALVRHSLYAVNARNKNIKKQCINA